MPHTHRFRPLWLLLCSPADVQGWHRIVTHCRCLDCGHEAVLAAWQSPTALNGRLVEEDTP